MKILECEIEGYRRLIAAKGELGVKFSSRMQLVLGSNGSGKSSLFDVIIGLPGNRADFKPNSKCSFLLEDDKGIRYRIKYHYLKSKVECSFYNEDSKEELNKGGTASVQKDIFAKTFNYDKEVHDLLVGTANNRFSMFTAAKRKYWFSKFSEVDMTYLISKFQEAKTKERDLKGAIRTMSARMANEQQKLATLAIDVDAEQRINDITSKLNTLLVERDISVDSSDNAKAKLLSHMETLDHAIEVFNKTKRVYSDSDINDHETLSARITSISTELEMIQAQHHETSEELYEQEDKRRRLIDLGSERLADMEAYAKQLLDEILSIPEGDIAAYGENPKALYEEFKSLLPGLNNYLATLPTNLKPQHDVPLNEAREKLTLVKNKFIKAEAQRDALASKLHNALGCDELTCPSCSTSFNPVMAKEEQDTIRERLDKASNYLNGLITEQESLATIIEDWERYHKVLDFISEGKRKYPMCHYVFEFIENSPALITTPSTLPSALNELCASIGNAVTKLDKQKELDELESAIITIKQSEANANIETMTAYAQKLTERLENFGTRRKELLDERSRLERLSDDLKRYGNSARMILSQIQALDEMQLDLVRSEYQETIAKDIAELQTQLAVLNEQVSKYKVLEGVINELEKQIVSMQADEVHWSQVVKALSPETGLIAKQLGSQIGVFVSRMNAIINAVWEYNLEVNPCGLDNNGLNYKFPVTSSDRGTEVPDIAACSAGQAEIIDFAFRVVAMRYLGIKGHPLFLDELGATFDEAHRNKLIHFLNYLLDSGLVGQMFLINHYSSMHGAISTPEVLVLDAKNIAVPNGYNAHVYKGLGN